MAITLHGIPNCSTVKKARAWLEARGVDYSFRDYKKTPPTRTEIEGWLVHLTTEALVNRKGTTWRQLDEAQREAAATRDGAIELMIAKPSVIKRPLVEGAAECLLGFDEAAYARVFG
ncbi:arsenate reductase [Derxia gummosa]|uniref:Arsenate reductase n=1 Tax=Derxia gummosa DSM 723 TaxID=1121388 RepID=A0A8B6X3G3_9BURK|nr:arsenate reductase [Derxia gummosa]